MDPTTFDALVRSFATGGTRRRLLTVLAALPLGGAFAFGEEDVEAERPRDRMHRRNKQRKRKHRNNRRRNNKHKNHGGKGGSRPDNCTPDGKACSLNSDCCGGNCFDQVCVDPVTECNGAPCTPPATGCCEGDCCAAPTNQCNPEGLCCSPNCDVRECGADGCGGAGTCGSCKRGQSCNATTGQCEGAPACNGATCPNGCCDVGGACRTDQRSCKGIGGPCCAGCCDENLACQSGDDDLACGADGNACEPCVFSGHCVNGRCQCDADLCPNGCCGNGPGQPGECSTGDPRFCGTGGALCKLVNGEQCNEDSACCSDNCFGGVCAESVTACGGITCARISRGCCGTICCDDAATCCGAGAICQNNQCVCNAQTCSGCCEHGPGNPGRCLENAPPQCGIGGAQCQSCPQGCCDIGGSCQAGNTIENCAAASGVCQTCNDRLEVCQAEQCVLCEHDCPCQGQSICDGPTVAPNTSCGPSRTGVACFCAVKTNFEPFCAGGELLAPCLVTCVSDFDCEACYGATSGVACVNGGPRCDLVPGVANNFCALPCVK